VKRRRQRHRRHRLAATEQRHERLDGPRVGERGRERGSAAHGEESCDRLVNYGGVGVAEERVRRRRGSCRHQGGSDALRCCEQVGDGGQCHREGGRRIALVEQRTQISCDACGRNGGSVDV